MNSGIDSTVESLNLVNIEEHWVNLLTPEGLNYTPDDQVDKYNLYKTLIHNTVCGGLESIYPYAMQIINQYYSEANLYDFIEDYRRSNINKSPIFLQSLKPFVEYITSKTELLNKYSYLADLVQYDWLDYQASFARHHTNNQLEFQNTNLYINSTIQILPSQYNIVDILSELNSQNIPANSISPVNLLIYREFKSYEIKILSVNNLIINWLALLQNPECQEQELDIEDYAVLLGQLTQQNDNIANIQTELTESIDLLLEKQILGTISQ